MVLSSRFSPRLVWQEDSAGLDDCDGYQHCGMWLGWGPVSLSPFEIPCRVESRGLGSLVGPDWVESDKERLERLGATWTCWFLGRLNSPMYFFQWRVFMKINSSAGCTLWITWTLAIAERFAYGKCGWNMLDVGMRIKKINDLPCEFPKGTLFAWDLHLIMFNLCLHAGTFSTVPNPIVQAAIDVLGAGDSIFRLGIVRALRLVPQLEGIWGPWYDTFGVPNYDPRQWNEFSISDTLPWENQWDKQSVICAAPISANVD